MKYSTEKLADNLYHKKVLEGTEEGDNRKVDEARWVTMHGAHVLVGNDGSILAGGPKDKRKKLSSGALKAAITSAKNKIRKKVSAK